LCLYLIVFFADVLKLKYVKSKDCKQGVNQEGQESSKKSKLHDIINILKELLPFHIIAICKHNQWQAANEEYIIIKIN